jgi:hypothetical protein
MKPCAQMNEIRKTAREEIKTLKCECSGCMGRGK